LGAAQDDAVVILLSVDHDQYRERCAKSTVFAKELAALVDRAGESRVGGLGVVFERIEFSKRP
jgi:hypothetical protein